MPVLSFDVVLGGDVSFDMLARISRCPVTIEPVRARTSCGCAVVSDSGFRNHLMHLAHNKTRLPLMKQGYVYRDLRAMGTLQP